jgi:hypothetical protein
MAVVTVAVDRRATRRDVPVVFTAVMVAPERAADKARRRGRSGADGVGREENGFDTCL